MMRDIYQEQLNNLHQELIQILQLLLIQISHTLSSLSRTGP